MEVFGNIEHQILVNKKQILEDSSRKNSFKQGKKLTVQFV